MAVKPLPDLIKRAMLAFIGALVLLDQGEEGGFADASGSPAWQLPVRMAAILMTAEIHSLHSCFISVGDNLIAYGARVFNAVQRNT